MSDNPFSEEFECEVIPPHRSKHEAVGKAAQGENDDGGGENTGGEGSGNN